MAEPVASAPVRSSVPEIAWPAWPSPADAELLGLYYQLAASEWWPRRRLLASQLGQAEILIDYARAAVPFYRDRIPRQSRRLTLEKFREIPVVRRSDIQSAGASLLPREVPPGHGPAQEVQTSGSTGRPLRARMTPVTSLIGQAMNLRTARWHGLDLSIRLASIRPVTQRDGTDVREGKESRWLPVFESAELVMLDPLAPAAEQLDWLVRHSPCYLQTYPSVLAGLARAARGAPIPRLPRVFTFGEMLEPRVRDLCREVFRAEIVDCYSAIECGSLALQCPGSGRYHVMSESALLEVLDDAGRPCRPGAVGRVVVTVLHNFAMPLIRYDLGDFAEVGSACPCGRGLPTLERIVGRARNLLTLPDGRRRWPFPHSSVFAGREPIRQFQIVQVAPDALEVRLALARPFTGSEQSDLERDLLTALGHPFRLSCRFMDEIPRGPGGKFEDFVGLPDAA